jgi:hypothetical protein
MTRSRWPVEAPGFAVPGFVTVASLLTLGVLVCVLWPCGGQKFAENASLEDESCLARKKLVRSL